MGWDVYGEGELTFQGGEAAWVSLDLKWTCVENCEEMSVDKAERSMAVRNQLFQNSQNVEQYAK